MAIILSATLLRSTIAADNRPMPIPGLTYFPDSNAIVIHNGTIWDNRPLYCNRRYTVILAGEMPSLNGPMGTLYGGIARGETRVLLQHFAGRIARPGAALKDITLETLSQEVVIGLMGVSVMNPR